MYAGKRDYAQVRNSRRYIRRHNPMLTQGVTGGTKNIKKYNPSEA
jgi:hypothetical protein